MNNSDQGSTGTLARSHNLVPYASDGRCIGRTNFSLPAGIVSKVGQVSLLRPATQYLGATVVAQRDADWPHAADQYLLPKGGEHSRGSAYTLSSFGRASFSLPMFRSKVGQVSLLKPATKGSVSERGCHSLSFRRKPESRRRTVAMAVALSVALSGVEGRSRRAGRGQPLAVSPGAPK